jgi:voltage-gated potassium channel
LADKKQGKEFPLSSIWRNIVKITRENIVKKLKAFIEHPITGVTILGLILMSIIILLIEVVLPIDGQELDYLNLLNDFILSLFVIELIIRYIICDNFKQFLKLHWIDIIAILPMLRVFRLGRAFRIVRIFRLLSFGAHVNRHLGVLKTLFQKRLMEYVLLLIFTLFVVIFGTLALTAAEKGVNPAFQNPVTAIWATLFTILAGEFTDQFPVTLWGKITALAIMFFSMTFFAMITGTVSALMMEKFRMGASAKNMNFKEFSGHIIFCGINNKLKVILKEFQLKQDWKKKSVIIISENIDENEMEETLIRNKIDCTRIYFIDGDFTRIDILEKVNIKNASCAIILADRREHSTDYDVDARTVLAALTIERLHPEVYTCAELLHREYEDHLKMGGVNDIIVTEDFGGNMLAHATINKGLTKFYNELLTTEYGSEVYRVDTPEFLLKRTYKEAYHQLMDQYEVILVGVERNNILKVNPKEFILTTRDQILIIAEEAPNFAA